MALRIGESPTGNHYSFAHKPIEPASNKQSTALKLVPKWCYTT